MPSNMMEAIASDAILGQAYAWLCKRREHYSHNDEVWELRYRWPEIKSWLQRELLGARYRFAPLRRIHRPDDSLEIWSARDSLVLKAMSLVLTRYLAPRLSSRCFHLAGNGGAKAAVHQVVGSLPKNRFVFRTDVKGYYASIHHETVHAQLAEHIDDPRLLDLLWQYLHRTVYDDGLYEDVEQGISLGCPLSPLIGALFLDRLDKRMEATGLFYVRFMDDWVVLAPTRWKLRRAVAVVNQTLDALRVQQHPDKTFIGRISRGFDFLGYQISPHELRMATNTVWSFVARLCQLYEQGADSLRIGQYVRRWKSWATATGLHVDGISLFGAAGGSVVFSSDRQVLDVHVDTNAYQHPTHRQAPSTRLPTRARAPRRLA